MKRVMIALATVALAAGALVGWAASRPPARPSRSQPSRRVCRRCRRRSRHESGWNIAVKCDQPPFGYIGLQSKNAGFDVEIGQAGSLASRSASRTA